MGRVSALTRLLNAVESGRWSGPVKGRLVVRRRADFARLYWPCQRIMTLGGIHSAGVVEVRPLARVGSPEAAGAMAGDPSRRVPRRRAL
jgi:hypothetical protein